jgi:hypothetical protein
VQRDLRGDGQAHPLAAAGEARPQVDVIPVRSADRARHRRVGG